MDSAQDMVTTFMVPGGVALVSLLYTIWALWSGYGHFRHGWRRVYRRDEPGFYWFSMFLSGVFLPVGVVVAIIWGGDL